MAELQKPAETLAFGDVWGEVDRIFAFNTPLGDQRFRPEARHQQGLNVTCSDGHAKWIQEGDRKMQCPPRFAPTVCVPSARTSGWNDTASLIRGGVFVCLGR